MALCLRKMQVQKIYDKYPVLFISAATCELLKEKENDENFFPYDPFRVNEKENGHKIQSYNTQTKNYQKMQRKREST